LADWVNRLRSRLRRTDGSGVQNLVNDSMTISERVEATEILALNRDLAINLRNIKEITGTSDDIGIREILITRERIKAAIVYIEGLVDASAIESAIDNLALETFRIARDQGKVKPLDIAIRDILISQKGIQEVTDFSTLWAEVSMGNTGLLIHGQANAFVIDSQGWRSRGIEEPQSEPVIRGPREGFVESLQVNLSLLRRRIRTPHLHVKILTIGRLTQTDVAYVYVKGLATEGLIDEVRQRLERIDIDGVLAGGYLEDFIEDTPFTLFPLVFNTERPDRVAAHLLEGKVAIFADGSPEALVVPITLYSTLQAPDDYYERLLFMGFCIVAHRCTADPALDSLWD
jgi:spore germination protein KA